MKPNMGNTDRVLRVVAAVLVGVFYLLGVIRGPVALGLGIAAAVLVATSVLGFCPLYAPFGIKTTK